VNIPVSTDPEPFYQFVCYHNGESEIRLVNPGDRLHPAGFSSCSGGRPRTEAELRESQKIHTEPCVECGQMFDANYNRELSKRLHESSTCFYCDFWLKLIGRKHAVRINGTHYMGRAGERGDGHGGRTFRIRMLGTGEEFETSNLWCQGNIPPHFRERLPDNAEFVTTPKPIAHGQGYLG